MLCNKIWNPIFVLLVLLSLNSCRVHHFRNNYKDANQLMHGSASLQTKPYLKAHLKNGDICILRDSWGLDTVSDRLTGIGERYDFNRRRVSEGEISIVVDSVAIFETNTKLKNPEAGRIAALTILAGLDLALTAYCITVPKACFGSCPTFYMDGHDDFHHADAEGFSNAISPSMEYADVDALDKYQSEHGAFSITMKNEALETHCVNDVKLLAYPLKKGERVYQSPTNDFYLCDTNCTLKHATADEGSIMNLLNTEDGKERFSLADENNLSSKEEIFLTFVNQGNTNQKGLILNFRQTLMTTYFIYSAIGYMGDEVSDIFAKVETSDGTLEKIKGGLKDELGKVDIYLWNVEEAVWDLLDGFYETGPIAPNRQFIPFQVNSAGSEIKLKIVLNKGLWRLDYASVSNVIGKVNPVEIAPSALYEKGKYNPITCNAVNDPDQYLISMPGCEYRFDFELPELDTEYELFLCSKGYYLEWMREHWIKDKDLLKLKQMLDNPERYLKSEAANYKMYEIQMEEEFWNSKINTETFSFDENYYIHNRNRGADK